MQNIGLPLSFSWKVARAGYDWIDTKEGRLLCAKDAVQPDWHNLFDRYETTYHPLEERTGLFWEFIALEPTEAQTLVFANRFGLLTAGEDHQFGSEFGTVSGPGESLKLWRDEIEAFKLAVLLWSTILSGDKQELADLRVKFAAPNLPLAVQQRLHPDDEDSARAVLGMIQGITDWRLRKWVEVRLLFQGDQPRLGGSLMPQNLIGALWLQFAAAVDAHKDFVKCPQCGTSFELSRDPQTGKRRDAQYCSARCRVAHYRGRIERARQLRAKGLTPGQIARELGTQARTVNHWLKGLG